MTVLVPSITETDQKRVNLSIQQLAAGRSNAYGSVTLTISVTTTTVTDNNCSSNSVILLMPTTANAAAEIGNGTIYVSTVVNKSFTITHASNTQTDRTFKYAIHG